jgi:PAS domain S-box-containing protein
MIMDIYKAENFKEFEEKFKFLFDNAADSMVILDDKGKFIQINKKVKEILGYEEKDLIGKKFTETIILTNKSKLIAFKNFIKRMAGFEIKPYEIEIIKKNGDMVIGEINASTIKKDGKIIGDMVIIRDITEKKKAEEELRRSKEELQSKVEELEKFNKMTIGRELRMIELKRRIKELEYELKKKKENKLI